MTRIHLNRLGIHLVFLSVALAATWHCVLALGFPGPAPGEAGGRIDGSTLVLENQVLAVHWEAAGGLRLTRVVDKLAGRTLEFGQVECFQIVVNDSPLPAARTIKASNLRIVSAPEVLKMEGKPNSVRLAERYGGRQLVARLVSPDGNLEVEWRAQLRDGSNYIRQHLQLKVGREMLEIQEVVLLDLETPRAELIGTVDGSPVVAANVFFGYEHPMSRTQVLEVPGRDLRRIRCSYPHVGMLKPGEPLKHSLVMGVVPEGQLRRGFLYYLERERVQPYRPFLHHNNGADIGMTYRKLLRENPAEAKEYRRRQEQTWREIIEIYGRELIRGRGVVMDSFVHDFKWDDETLVWQFHEGYPNGFTPLQLVAERLDSRLGVWLSPWGRTGGPERVEHGRRQCFEANENGLSMAGPIYFARFRSACVNMLRTYGLNYFKFDGFGAGNNADGAGPFRSDVEALLSLIEELRGLKPDLFVNPSTGSWPSPFWLLYADSIWRAGSDAGVFGKGSLRQQWITYRDNETLHSALRRGPLYPLNSYMLHGIMVNTGARVKTFETKDIIDEIRSFFGTGTNLQELYVAPSLMTAETWDALAEAANWSRRNADVLVDTHWVGGDPSKDEVYGWASWNNQKGILTLRNPDDKRAEIALDIEEAFELPKGAVRSYSLKSPWEEDINEPSLALTADRRHVFQLEPFQVLVFDAIPQE